MSNSRAIIVGRGISSLGLAIALINWSDAAADPLGDLESMAEALVCGPRDGLDDIPVKLEPYIPGRNEGGKRGSADWKQHTNRRGKRRKWG